MTWLAAPGELPFLGFQPSLYTHPRVVGEDGEQWGTLLRALVGMLVGENVTECTAEYSPSHMFILKSFISFTYFIIINK